ncbi:hypothetical protein HZH66_013990 [Vespula vulgaris]|uniref:PiggyBac transposable element-derived protein domain-containing protein n=1 Tax=Vespula vulgaris TaxID=7454 RepID=A0A834J5Q0_VESVU|nr:hypothetical protein HZH66_013990 [Vespula vulgaris]
MNTGPTTNYRTKFLEVMSRDRFLYLLKILHFNTNKVIANTDKLYKIREICDMFRKSFRKIFYPFENLYIDESLLLYKGSLSFKQHIPSKRDRFGIKSFILCDTQSGFVQDFIIYNRALSFATCESESIDKSGVIVMQVVKPYLHKGHTFLRIQGVEEQQTLHARDEHKSMEIHLHYTQLPNAYSRQRSVASNDSFGRLRRKPRRTNDNAKRCFSIFNLFQIKMNPKSNSNSFAYKNRSQWRSRQTSTYNFTSNHHDALGIESTETKDYENRSVQIQLPSISSIQKWILPTNFAASQLSQSEISRNLRPGQMTGSKFNYELYIYVISSVHHQLFHSWYRNLGYRNFEEIKEIVSKGMIMGVMIKESDSKSKKILELIHTDLCESLQTIMPEKKCCILILIDDYKVNGEDTEESEKIREENTEDDIEEHGEGNEDEDHHTKPKKNRRSYKDNFAEHAIVFWT